MTRIKLDGDRKRIKLTQVGKRGPQGIQGIAATIEIGQTTTVSPGSPASVVNVGNPNDAILDFEIPQGIQGPVGEGVEPGGTTGQVLRKNSNTDYDTEWGTIAKSDIGLGSVPDLDTTTAVANQHTHSNKSTLDAITAPYTTGEKDKLAGVEANAEVNVINSVNGQVGDVVLDTDDLDDTLANNKFISQNEKNKLAGIAAGATVNQTDAQLRDRATHTGTQAISTVSGLQSALDTKAATAALTAHTSNTNNPHETTKAQVGLSNVPNTDFTADVTANTAARHTHSNKATLDATTASFTTAQEAKLSGIATGATANATNAQLRDRSTHTGTQAQSTITNLTTDLAAKANASATVNLTGDQTVAGVKTFSSSPVVPTATTNTQVVNKAQMDTADAQKVNKAGDTMTGELRSTSAGVGYSQTRASKKIMFGSSPSDNFIAYNDTDGIFLLTALSTGKGIHLGSSSSPNIIHGTGFPNGVVSAPVGSAYIDTAATNGAIEWKKATGAGNTGWVVSVGKVIRNISSLANIASGSIYLIRDAGTCMLYLVDVIASPAAVAGSHLQLITNYSTALPGFLLASSLSGVVNVSDTDQRRAQMNNSVFTVRTATTSMGINGSIAYSTNDAWPSTLPGTAV